MAASDSNGLPVSQLDFAQKKAEEMVEQHGLTKMSTWVGEGPMTFRVAALAGGFVMILQGFYSFLGEFLTLSMLQAILDIYTFFFGFVIVMLEGRGFLYPSSVKALLARQAKFLTLLNGRGALYVFLGTLRIAQWPDLGATLLGWYMVLLGLTMAIVGHHAKTKLDTVRVLLPEEQLVRMAFQKADVEGDGSLTLAELGQLCSTLGSTLGAHELETALATLDRNGNGQVEYAEFLDWWKGGATEETGAKRFLY